MRLRISLLVVASLLTAGAVGVVPGSPALAAASFTVQPSVRQVAVLHATPGSGLELRRNGELVDGGEVDAQGSYLWRGVEPGPGYTVRAGEGDDATESDAVTVLSPTEIPPQSFYDDQQLTDGFGYITVRDGTKLAATVHLPGPIEDGPYPTVVEYSGYDPANPYAPQPSTLVANLLGYAVVGVNLRGQGCSGGSFYYFEELQSLDGYDVVEAVAAQPWVKFGEVGMVGISYPGITQLFTAQTRPPHLAAIAPLSVISDTYRSTLAPGGIPNIGFARDWARERERTARPYGQGWERRVVDEGGPNGAQCAENQLLRLQNPDTISLIDANEFYIPELLDPLAPERFVDQVDVPVFMAGAWQDEQVGGQSPVMFSRFTNSPDRHFFATNGLHVDPWLAQLQPWTEFLDFYVGRRIPHVPELFRAIVPVVFSSAIGNDGVALPPDRFDGYATYEEALAAYQAEPDVRILFENGAGAPDNLGAPAGTFEEGFSQWPPAETEATTWYFQPDGKLTARPPTVPDRDGRATSSYQYDPAAKPWSNLAGGNIWGTSPNWDWRPLPLGKALAFESAPLDADLTMVGTGSVDLWLRSTASDTDVEVTLTEVRPDGKERYVQNGWLRASHRALDATRSTALRPVQTHLADDAAPLEAGRLHRMRVEIFPFAHVFRAGSRVRISVEAPGGNRSDWKFRTIVPTGTVINEVGHSVRRASRVVLPVIPDVAAPAGLAPCPSLRGQPCRPAYGIATPVSARARVLGTNTVVVRWLDPRSVRPGRTIASLRVRDTVTGRIRSLPPQANEARFERVRAGAHAYAIEAVYDDGTSSGWSTPSRTVTTTSAR